MVCTTTTLGTIRGRCSFVSRRECLQRLIPMSICASMNEILLQKHNPSETRMTQTAGSGFSLSVHRREWSR